MGQPKKNFTRLTVLPSQGGMCTCVYMEGSGCRKGCATCLWHKVASRARRQLYYTRVAQECMAIALRD